MQFYDTNQEFLKPVARPQAYRQNTAPASSLSIQNLQQHQLQQQQQQAYYNHLQQQNTLKSSDVGLANRHLNVANDHLHVRRESFLMKLNPKLKRADQGRSQHSIYN